MNLKLSKTAIRELTRRYRAVLMAAVTAGAFVATGANAADTFSDAITGTTNFMDNLHAANPSWDRNNGVVTGWGVDQILAIMSPAATNIDSVVSAVNNTTTGLSATNTLANNNKTAIETLNGTGDGSVSKTVGDAIAALNLTDTYQAKLTAGSGIAISTGNEISVSGITNANIADGAAIAQSKIDGLTDALGGKQNTLSDTNKLDSKFIDTTNYDSSDLKTAVVGTKVDNATSADSAKAVTSDAIDGSTIVLDSGKIKVGTIAQSQVTGLTAALDNISVSVASGVATITDDAGTSTTVYTKDQADTLLAGKQDLLTNAKNAADGIVITDGADPKIGVKLASGTTNPGLAFSDGGLAVKTDGNTLEVTASGVQIKKLGVGTDQLASQSVTLAKLNSDVVDGTTLNLTGSGIAIAAGGVNTTQLADGAVTIGKLNAGLYSTTVGSGSDTVLATTSAVKSYTDGALSDAIKFNGDNTVTLTVGSNSANLYDATGTDAAIKTQAESADYTAVSGAVDLTSNTTLAGALQALDTTKASLSKDNTFSGNNTFSGGNTFSGVTTFTNTADFRSGVTISDGGANAVKLTASANGLSVDKAVTLNDALTVAGATTLNDTLDVAGATTLASTLDVTGATTLASTLDVTGLSTLTGGLTFNGTDKATALDTGATAISGDGSAETLATTATLMTSAENAKFTTTGHNITSATTLGDAISQLDSVAIGDRNSYSAENVITKNESVAESLDNLDVAIGDLQYSSTSYTGAGDDLTSAVGSLDGNLRRVDDNVAVLNSQVSDLYNRTNKMHHEMKSGFASLAALSGLVPDARSAGDTQISLGTGYYRGTTGFALGAFHHVNDNLLLNVGAAYAGNGSATFKGGVTFGF